VLLLGAWNHIYAGALKTGSPLPESAQLRTSRRLGKTGIVDPKQTVVLLDPDIIHGGGETLKIELPEIQRDPAP
jgi:hypothetical protein